MVALSQLAGAALPSPRLGSEDQGSECGRTEGC